MQIPEGYLKNAAGHLVPADKVRESDKFRDAAVRELALEAVELNKRLAAFKRKALRDIQDLIKISAERYKVELGGDKGNVSLATYDGEFKVLRAFAERLSFTEELQTAKALVDKCIRKWSEGANGNIQVLVDRAFRTDRKGDIRSTAILELLRFEIDDPDWKTAMEALKDSIQAVGSAVYVRVYRRLEGSDSYVAVPLDLAAVQG